MYKAANMIVPIRYLASLVVAALTIVVVVSTYDIPDKIWAARFGKNTTSSIVAPEAGIKDNATRPGISTDDRNATLQEPKAETKALESSNFVSYENTSIGVKLDYPSNFEKLNFGNSIVFHTPPQPNEGPLFSEQLAILTLDTLPIESESIEQFLRRQLDNFKSSFPDYTLSDGPTSINLDGNPALEAKFASPLVDNMKYRLMEIWTINQDKSRAYQIEISIRVR
jgi:hypothetical protein